MEKKILFWDASTMKNVDRRKLEKFLSRKTFTIWRRSSNDENVYEFLLRNLKNTTAIQIYQDGVIRLHSAYNAKSIFWEQPEKICDELTVKMVEELATFLKNN